MLIGASVLPSIGGNILKQNIKKVADNYIDTFSKTKQVRGADKVGISEIYYAAPYEEQFIEIYVWEDAGSDINIENWYLTTFDDDYTYLPHISGLEQYDYVAIVMGFGTDDLNASDGNATIYLSLSYSMLEDPGDEVGLYDNDGVLIDFIRYGGGNGDPVLGGWNWGDLGASSESLESIQIHGQDLDNSSNWISAPPSAAEPNVDEWLMDADDNLYYIIHNGQHYDILFPPEVPADRPDWYFNQSGPFSIAEKNKIKEWLNHTHDYMKVRGLGTAQNASDGRVHIHLSGTNRPPSGHAGGRAWNNPSSGSPAPEGHIFLKLGNLSNRNESIMAKQTVEHEHVHLIQYRNGCADVGHYGGLRNFSDLEGMAEYWATNIAMDNFGLTLDEYLAIHNKVYDRVGSGFDWERFLMDMDVDFYTDFKSNLTYYWTIHMFLRWIAQVFGEEKVKRIFLVRNVSQGMVGIIRAVNRAFEIQPEHNHTFRYLLENWTKWLWENYRDKIRLALDVAFDGINNITESGSLNPWGTDYERIVTPTDNGTYIRFNGSANTNYSITFFIKWKDGTTSNFTRRFSGTRIFWFCGDSEEIIMIKRQIDGETARPYDINISRHFVDCTVYAPTAPIPAHASINLPYDPEGIHLTWSSGDIDPYDEVRYRYGFGTDYDPPPTIEYSTDWLPYDHPPVTVFYPYAMMDDTTYYWTVHVEALSGGYVEGPVWEFSTGGEINEPPDIPTIVGEGAAHIGVEYDIVATTIDPNDYDQLFYTFDWDDGTVDWWLGPYGEDCIASHIWTEPGTYDIQVMVKDSIGPPSDWSSFTVEVPDEYYLNLDDFPMYEAEESPGHSYNEMCGPAVAQMTLNYIWWNRIENPAEIPMLFDQLWLYDEGIIYNYDQTIPYLDSQGLWHVIQYNKPMPYSEYGYNFARRSSKDYNYMLEQICQWIDYPVGTYGGYTEGHPEHVPAVIPAYGGYSNWMAIRGFLTDRPAYPQPEELNIIGFWINDPLPEGDIGEYKFVTSEEFISIYYQPLVVDVPPDDPYYNKYYAIVEPPETEHNVNINQVTSPTRFSSEDIELMKAVQQMDKCILPDDIIKHIEQSVIQAAIDGVTEQLIPFDSDFASVFAETVPGQSIFVSSEVSDDYYLVPFNIRTDKILPFQAIDSQIISNQRINTLFNDNKITTVVIRINAEDGSFKEASWVKTPVRYLPISGEDAQKIVFETIKKTGIGWKDIDNARVELVYRDSTPYYPDWKITLKDMVFFVGQEGTVSY